MERLISLLIGYLLGCFLTAETVAHRWAGTGAANLGDTGNPGMANIMGSLGFVPGIVTLAGDLGKCIAAGLICYGLFHTEGWIIVLYAGVGCTLGHDFPFWRHFRGGKGVATTSMAIVLYAFLPGLLSNLAGMGVVFATQYLCIGGPVIPGVFMILMLIRSDVEAAVLAAFLTLLSLWKHGPAILRIREGKTKKTDVIGAVTKKLKK